MKNRLAVACLWAGLPLLLGGTSVRAQVRVESGLLRGTTADGVEAFLGVPYAAPPVAELRWRAPRPPAHWQGTRAATAYGHDCMQTPFPSDAAPLGTEPAEDCLVLNVWRPAARTGDRLPVMVWIYGGGFVNGGSSPAVYSGAAFARHGLVFVSFNYRLGRFGFFAHPAITRTAGREPLGNYGYMDQIAALEWVKRNIAAFGGDPRNVTIFGESAGGGSVLALLTSPAVPAGLFKKAIVESGGGRGLLMGMRRVREDLPNNPSGESIGMNFARALGIEGTDAAAAQALRALPAEKVLQGLNMATMMPRQGPPTYAGPMLDGTIVTASPQEALTRGQWAKVPVMIGANSLDIGFLMVRSADELFASFGADSGAARAAYAELAGGDFRRLVQAVGADQMMVEPSRFVARVVAAQGLPAYEYRFSYVAASLRDKVPGAPHATEIPFVFNTVAAKYGAELKPEDEATARAANAYWANFARTGNPNGPGFPEWPAYRSAEDAIMDFSPAGPKAGPDPWKARLDVIEDRAQKPVS